MRNPFVQKPKTGDSCQRKANSCKKQDNRFGRALIWLSESLLRIFACYLLSLLLAALLFMIFESEQDLSYGDSLYWAYVTALSIGYGDISPATELGRLLGFLFGHLWIYFVGALIIVNIVERVRRNHNELTHEEQEWTFAALTLIAERLEVSLPPQPQDTDHGNHDTDTKPDTQPQGTIYDSPAGCDIQNSDVTVCV